MSISSLLLSHKNRLFIKSLLLFCLPLLLASVLLIILITNQGIRFKISETGPRLDGTYQIVLLSNIVLSKDTLPEISLVPQSEVSVSVSGNRITVISKQPLLADTEYRISVSGAKTSIGSKQTKPSTDMFKTNQITGLGVHRQLGADSIERILIKDKQLLVKKVVSAETITFLGTSPDYIWWTSSKDPKNHTLHTFDKKSEEISTLELPKDVIIESLAVSKETNDAVCILFSSNKNPDNSVAEDHSVYTINADQKSITKQPAPLNSAAAALISPNGAYLLVQSRDGSVFAKSLLETEPLPLGRTRLIGPFSGDSSTIIMRSLESTHAYRLLTAQKDEVAAIPTYAAQVQTNYTGNQFLYSLTDFTEDQKSIVRVYKLVQDSPPAPIYNLPENTYSGRLVSVPSLQYSAIEVVTKGAQFDTYTGNAKPLNLQTEIITSDGQKIGTVPLVDVIWE
jgi:hypothetical protein